MRDFQITTADIDPPPAASLLNLSNPRLKGDTIIAENWEGYWIEGCIAGTNVIIKKASPKGIYITDLLNAHGDRKELYSYVNLMIIRHVDTTEFERMVKAYYNAAFRAGRDDKALEIAKALNLK